MINVTFLKDAIYTTVHPFMSKQDKLTQNRPKNIKFSRNFVPIIKFERLS